jgi:hypothetical protein
MTMKILLCSVLTVASLVTTTEAGAVEVTMDNYESLVSGKNAFVKFLAPW